MFCCYTIVFILSKTNKCISFAELNIPGVPKHMKRFESLITFDSTKICCLLCLLINVLYWSNIIMPNVDLISFYENARFSFLKRGSNFLIYTVFTSMDSFLTLYI